MCVCVCVCVCVWGRGGLTEYQDILFLWIQNILCIKCKYNALVVNGLHVLHIFLEPLIYIFDREYHGLKTLQKWCNSGVCILIKWDTRYFFGAYSWTWIPDGMVLAKPIVHAQERGKLFPSTVGFALLVQSSPVLPFSLVSSFRRAHVWPFFSSPHILKDFVEIHPSLSFMYEREQYPPRVKTRKAKKWGEVWTIYIHVWNAKYKSLDIWIKRLCDKQQEQQHQQQISMPVLDSCCCKV